MSENYQNLFSEFKPISKEEWLACIEKDLKGRNIAELTWQLPPLSINPFLHSDDYKGKKPQPILDSKTDNTWEIGESFAWDIKDLTVFNKNILSALMGGSNTLFLNVNEYPSDNQLVTLLDKIEIDYISIYFKEKVQKKNPLDFLKAYKKYAFKKEKDYAILRGGVQYAPHLKKDKDVESFISTYRWTEENLPLFQILHIEEDKNRDFIEALTMLLIKGEKYLNTLKNKGLDIGFLCNKMFFSFDIGNSYFLELAKLRAFKLLWANIQKAYDINPSVPHVHAYIRPSNVVTDANTYTIQATTAAMSAAIAGVDVLVIEPSRYGNETHKRTVRNIQHLLQMESYMDKVKDPAAGSYYIEYLTEQIAERVWAKFQEKF